MRQWKFPRCPDPRADLIPFAQIRRADGKAVGCTAYFEQRTWPGSDRLRAIQIGFTWLAASAQGTGINAGAKLLLTYAFETLGVARVGSVLRHRRRMAGR